MAGTLLYRFTVAMIYQKGYFKKIIREDLEMNLEAFADAYEKYRGIIHSCKNPVFLRNRFFSVRSQDRNLTSSTPILPHYPAA
jgi:hypothetical protein